MKQAGGLKEDAEIERDVSNTGHGAMSDASKRRLDDWSTSGNVRRGRKRSPDDARL